MAEVVALISVLIPKVISLLEGEFNLHSKMRSDLLKIANELENMKAFLLESDSNSTLESSSLLDEVWLKQVRELASDSEDIVDEFMLDFAKDGSKIQKFFRSFKYVSRTKEIRSRTIEVRESNKRYRRTDLPLNSAPPFKLYDPQQDAIFNDDGLVGRDQYVNGLIDTLCLNSVRMKVISVVGTGGVGKTSLVKKVYDNADVKNTFQTKAWVSVSRDFRPDAFFKNLIEQLQRKMSHPELGELGDMRSLGFKQEVNELLQDVNVIDLQQFAKEILQRGTYLVVLDDIWTTDAWNAIRNTFPNSPGCNSKVLITTRNEEVGLAATNGDTSNMINLTPLSQEHWLPLFCKNTPYDPDDFPEQLVEVTNSILKKCAGTPLAIVAIRGILFTKNPTAIEWGNVNKNLEAALDIGTKSVLLLGYTDLPYFLKPCLLYLSIFPEDHKIEKNRLIRLWIAEGLVKREQDSACEQVAESYLNALVQRNLIQVADTLNEGLIETYCIHDILREIFIDKAKKQNFSIVVRGSKEKLPKEQEARRLSMHMNLSELKEQQTLRRLRSLVMFEVEQPLNNISVPSLFSKDFSFRMLAVLDMQGTILNEFPKNITKLRNLKYLNLSHTDLKSVPDSICRLLKLETLDLRCTYVTTLPRQIHKLQQLHSLLIYQYKKGTYPVFGFRAPAEIGRLQCLRSLFYIDAGLRCGDVVQQLGMLTQLTRLGIANFSNENANVLSSSMNNLCDLQAFSLSVSEDEDQALDLQALVLPSNSLQCLYLTGKLGSFPSWMASLRNIEKLYLRSCKLQTSPLETLGKLPNLVQLELVDACTTDSLEFGAAMFEKLRILDLHEFEHLELVIFKSGTMPNLERLRMVSCQKLRCVPDGINFLSKLTTIDLINLPSELKSKVKYIFENAVHVKEANWVYKDQDTWKLERIRSAGDARSLAPVTIPREIAIQYVHILQSGQEILGSSEETHDFQSSTGSDTPPNIRGMSRNVTKSFHTTTEDNDTPLERISVRLLVCLLLAAVVLFVFVCFYDQENERRRAFQRFEIELEKYIEDEPQPSGQMTEEIRLKTANDDGGRLRLE